jgi:LDH2 family malate/lactate/ureidoglycolate dehydrogenase
MDREGNLTTKVADRGGGGYILPIGGLRETGGHKGYGLMVLVDILTAVLSGASFGANMAKLTTAGAQAEGGRPVGMAANTGHFFGAMRVDGFRPLDEFKEVMDEMCMVIRSSEKLPGWDRVYTHGEIDWETEIYRREHGIPLDVRMNRWRRFLSSSRCR